MTRDCNRQDLIKIRWLSNSMGKTGLLLTAEQNVFEIGSLIGRPEFLKVALAGTCDSRAVRNQVTTLLEMTPKNVCLELRESFIGGINGEQIHDREGFRVDGIQLVRARLGVDVLEASICFVVQRDFQDDLKIMRRHEHREMREIDRGFSDQQHPVNADWRMMMPRAFVLGILTGHSSSPPLRGIEATTLLLSPSVRNLAWTASAARCHDSAGEPRRWFSKGSQGARIVAWLRCKRVRIPNDLSIVLEAISRSRGALEQFHHCVPRLNFSRRSTVTS